MPVRVELPGGDIAEFPDDMSEEDITTALRGHLDGPAPVQDAPKMRIPILRVGQKVTKEGPEFEYAESMDDPRISDGQRATLQALIKNGLYDPSASPGSHANPIFSVREEGKNTRPRGPVDASIVDPSGDKYVQKPTKNQTLGLTTGIRRATNNVGDALQIPFFKKGRIRDKEMIERARASGVEPGIIGDLAGTTIGTYPYVYATRNPMIGGAIAGGVNTDANDPMGVAIDVATGATVGKLADKAIAGMGSVIAPKVDAGLRRLTEKGIDLSPGQLLGGTVRNIEETLAGFPLVGGLVQGARNNATNTMNRAAVDEVLAPLGRTAAVDAAPAATPSVAGSVPRTATSGAPAIGIADDATRALPAPGATQVAGENPMLSLRGKQELGPASSPINGKPPTSLGPASSPIDGKPAGVPALQGTTPQFDDTVGKESKQVFDDIIQEAVPNGGQASKLPESVSTGHEAVEFAYNQIRNAYDDVLPKMQVKADKEFIDAFDAVAKESSMLPPELQNRFHKIMSDRFGAKMSEGAELGGQSFKDFDSYMSTQIRSFQKSMDPLQREYADVLRSAQDAVRDMAKRQNPSLAKRLGDVDEAYSKLLRIERAASNAPDGIFTPQGLRSAVTQLDTSGRRRASAQGKANMQEFADDAVRILGKSSTMGAQVPSRALLFGAGGAAAGGASGAINPLLAAVIGAPLLAYSKTGSKMVANAMLKRPAGANAARRVLEQSRQPVSLATAAQTEEIN